MIVSKSLAAAFVSRVAPVLSSHALSDLQSALHAQSAQPTLELRDVHVPAAPGWWPPAPGWWLIAILLLSAFAVWQWWRWRRKRRHAAILNIFDAEVASVQIAPAKIAKMSELLRRAGRLRDPNADHLHGEAWLQFLDRGLDTPVFSAGVGRTLLEGGFRREVTEHELQSLHAVVRARFVQLMERRA